MRKDRCSSSGNLEAVLQHRPVIKSCLNEVKLALIDLSLMDGNQNFDGQVPSETQRQAEANNMKKL